MNITFLASDACLCAQGNDSAGMVINNELLIDTGYSVLDNLKKIGINPRDIEHIYFTHLHHDHYLGLPHLIFWYLQTNKPLDKLHIYGPKADLRRVVDLTMRFLQAGKDQPFYKNSPYPVLHELEPGDTFETPSLKAEVGASFHAIDCLCCRLTDKESGKVLSVTGDTYYRSDIPVSLHDCDLLVHETSLADGKTDPANPPACRHSAIADAVRTATEAHAKRLFVIHFAESKAEAVIKAAAALTDIEVVYPKLFHPYEV
ncbi:MAG: MBL fold metallo-hydrolase [Clostridia bacterium]|nr:MBL fold metallo-hydrolase [Clostridia bacterium]